MIGACELKNGLFASSPPFIQAAGFLLLKCDRYHPACKITPTFPRVMISQTSAMSSSFPVLPCHGHTTVSHVALLKAALCHHRHPSLTPCLLGLQSLLFPIQVYSPFKAGWKYLIWSHSDLPVSSFIQQHIFSRVYKLMRKGTGTLQPVP